MPDKTKFQISRDGDSFYLPETPPWEGWKRPKNPGIFARNAQPFRVGWRCVAESHYDLKNEIERFNKSEASHPRQVNGHEVHVSAETGGDYGPHVVVDMWLEGSAHMKQFGLSEAVRTLETTKEQISKQLSFTLLWNRAQDFVEVKLPNFLAGKLTKDAAGRSSTGLKNIEMAKVTQNWLISGPEEPGTIEGVADYLQTQADDDSRDYNFSAFRYPRVLPFLFITTLLLTWRFPLRVWSIVGASVVITILMVMALWPTATVGWAATMRQTETVACLVFFGVSVFAIAYAICALRSTEALGVVDSLGYPFLVSTSVGIAGGVLGDPKGVIRVLIHVQLLLLVAAFIKVLAILLRIDRSVRGRRE